MAGRGGGRGRQPSSAWCTVTVPLCRLPEGLSSNHPPSRNHPPPTTCPSSPFPPPRHHHGGGAARGAQGEGQQPEAGGAGGPAQAHRPGRERLHRLRGVGRGLPGGWSGLGTPCMVRHWARKAWQTQHLPAQPGLPGPSLSPPPCPAPSPHTRPRRSSWPPPCPRTRLRRRRTCGPRLRTLTPTAAAPSPRRSCARRCRCGGQGAGGREGQAGGSEGQAVSAHAGPRCDGAVCVWGNGAGLIAAKVQAGLLRFVAQVAAHAVLLP